MKEAARDANNAIRKRAAGMLWIVWTERRRLLVLQLRPTYREPPRFNERLREVRSREETSVGGSFIAIVTDYVRQYRYFAPRSMLTAVSKFALKKREKTQKAEEDSCPSICHLVELAADRRSIK
jgi:hypothetical protein